MRHAVRPPILALFVTAAAILASCGAPTGQAVNEAAGTAAAPLSTAGVPATIAGDSGRDFLPARNKRYPDRYDANDCRTTRSAPLLKDIPPDRVDAAFADLSPADRAELKAARLPTLTGDAARQALTKRVLSFLDQYATVRHDCSSSGGPPERGGYWGSLPPTTSDAPAVLLSSIGVYDDARGWAAIGIVANGVSASPAELTVSARLIGSDGAPLGTATATALLPIVRSGEYAPFRVQSTVAAKAVARVEWSAVAAAVNGRSLERRFEFLDASASPSTATSATVLINTISWSPDISTSPQILIALVDSTGKVIGMKLVKPDDPGADVALTSIPTGKSAYFRGPVDVTLPLKKQYDARVEFWTFAP